MPDAPPNPALWHVAAQFFEGPDDVWLDDFIEDPQFRFQKIAPRARTESWHQRGGAAPASEWRGHFAQARDALQGAPFGVITCFPQLALAASVQKRMAPFRRTRLVAHNFNLGALRGRLKGRAAGAALSAVDRFLVHSRAEVSAYAGWLGLPPERFVFAPLQMGVLRHERRENLDAPFIAALGSAGRDYALLVAAADALRIRTIIVTSPQIAAGLARSDYVDVRTGLDLEACRKLTAEARLCVTPLANEDTASGQVTFLTSLQLGVPTLVTRAPGSVDYVDHMRTGVLLEPRSRSDLERHIALLWNDADLRERLGAAGRVKALAEYSDDAAARTLAAVLRSLGRPDFGLAKTGEAAQP